MSGNRGRIATLIDGTPGDTTRLVSTDSAQNLPADIITIGGKKSRFILLTTEEENMRYTIGPLATPTQGVSGVGHLLFPGMILELDNQVAIATFQYISAVAGVHGVFQVTGET